MSTASNAVLDAAKIADVLDLYGTDPGLEEDGVWSDEFRGGLEIKLRSTQAKEVKAAQQRASKRCERYWKTNQPVPEPIQIKNQIDLASAIAADWRVRVTKVGADDLLQLPVVGGQPLECTAENKKAVFGNPQLWSLRVDVIAQANMVDRYQKQALEDDAGNSAAPSGQGSSSAATASV